ncbi:MAG: stage II sporulation protein M [bacterium]
MSSSSTLRSYQFRREREESWRELEKLVSRVERRGIRTLSADELMRLPNLYRAALSALSVARSVSLDNNLVTYLESLAARAYFCVYGTRRTLTEAASEFFGYRFPAAVRAARWHLALAALTMILGVLTGHWLVSGNPDLYYAFVPEQLAAGRDPSASAEDLRGYLYESKGFDASSMTAFASYLFSHNAMVGIFSFALGFALGVPTLLLMFYNGLVLGAFSALHAARGLSFDLWGWLMIHRSTELTAIALCGGAGLVLGSSIAFPGRYRRLDNLARNGRQAGVIVLGAVFMLVAAGLLEGIGRQTITEPAARYVIAALMAGIWLAYFTLAGRERSP